MYNEFRVVRIHDQGWIKKSGDHGWIKKSGDQITVGK